ncbi:MAG: hypothetical protein HY821_10360 [Acidobacteria bacterium]|nr:hypothetical protein [Acidobacteriota bacterium]
MDPKGQVLQSWKEIGAYLQVTARSVQRWEKTSALPVHRQGNGHNSRIFAYPHELDAWLAAGGLARVSEEPEPVKRRYGVAIAGGLVLLAVASWGALRAGVLPWGRVPMAWSAEGAKLQIFDGRERLCWEKRFPPFHATVTPEAKNVVRIEDIDGDDRVEVLFNFNPQDRTAPRGTLYCYDSRGNLRWQYAYGKPRTFGDRSFSTDYFGQIVLPVKMPDGSRYVLTAANHILWYPAQVSLLDAQTGRLVEEYWHPGAIQMGLLQDLDRDGAAEFLFAAINNPGNGPGHAALGALKLPFSKARKERADMSGDLPPVTGGGEYAYLLFPHPDVCRARGTLPLPLFLRIEGGKQLLFGTPLPEYGGLIYTLGFDMQVLSFFISSQFEPLHNQIEHEGLLHHQFTAKEEAELSKPLRLPAAPDGNSSDLRRYWKYE